MPSTFEVFPLASSKKSSQWRKKGKSLFVSQPAAGVRRPPLMLKYTSSIFRGDGAGRHEGRHIHLRFLKQLAVTETPHIAAFFFKRRIRKQ